MMVNILDFVGQAVPATIIQLYCGSLKVTKIRVTEWARPCTNELYREKLKVGPGWPVSHRWPNPGS